jgi:hypothetical protein
MTLCRIVPFSAPVSRLFSLVNFGASSAAAGFTVSSGSFASLPSSDTVNFDFSLRAS